jgi:NhaA family Na+:H+ antiporter
MANIAKFNRVDRFGRPRLAHITSPFQQFVRTEAFGGILLLLCAIVALVWANSRWADIYEELWHYTKLTIGFGRFSLSEPLHFWINDGLMVIFFFVVGLEIKREILVGELSSLRQAALPIAAAFGGMLVPAIIYASLNAGAPGAPGWGIPMATDIAFALGILALVGKRAPLALKVFLAALAIVDDLGAVLVIALFYTAEISWLNLAIGGGFLTALIIANRLGLRHPFVYSLLGIGLWLAFLTSGIHATIAGILTAMMIPARTRINGEEFLRKSQALLQEFERTSVSGQDTLSNRYQRSAVQTMEVACREVQSPMRVLEHQLHPWVTYVIIPLFALVNAGVHLVGGDLKAALTNSVTLGIIVGLVIGKQIGVTLFAWLAVRTGLAAMPARVTWRQIYGVSWLAGIGFTMSLFIATLAFADVALLNMAKIGILAASLVAGVVGLIIVKRTQGETEQAQ